MLKLTNYEEKMLNGKMGKFKQKAMEFNVRYANVLGAEKFCEISRATLFIGAQHYLDCYKSSTDYKKIFSEFYLCSDETVEFGTMAAECKVQTCAASCDMWRCDKTHLTHEYSERNRAYTEAVRKMGVKTVESCTPYFVGWVPLMGEHFVSTESSNVVISNSFFGACGNSDGVEAAVCAAITGRSPEWGMHIKDNRLANCIVNVKCDIESVAEWDVLGHAIGRMMPKNVVPVLRGDFKRPEINKMRQFCSSISVTSAAELCHIIGLTPEAQTLDMATGGEKCACEFDVTAKDCAESIHMICDSGSGPVDYVSIGCPHLALDELKDIAEYLDGKRVKKGVELLIWTDYATKAMADANGYTGIIEESGAFVLTGSCPIVMREESHRHAAGMVMNGIKQAVGIKHQTKAPVYYGDISRCLDAALTGMWEA